MKAGRPNSPRDHAAQILSLLGQSWLPEMYRERVLTLRTRAYHFGKLPHKARVQIHHSLLGVELQVGRQRFLCPDLATARYLSVFARAGCEDVAIPYDITQISCLADDLESSWQRMLLLIEHNLPNSANHARIRGLIIAKLKAEIAEAGAGTVMPEFKQSTRQRKS